MNIKALYIALLVLSFACVFGCTRVPDEAVLTTTAVEEITVTTVQPTTAAASAAPAVATTVMATTATAATTVKPTTAPEMTPDKIASLIDRNMEIIINGYDSLFYEPGAAEAFPVEFGQIVALGESAFPHLDKIIEDNNKNRHESLAMYLKYSIKPELYELNFPSPDGKYAVKADVDSFFVQNLNRNGIRYINRRITPNSDDSALHVLKGVESNIEVEWSPDSRYAAISHGHYHLYFYTDVYNTVNMEYIELPKKEELEKLLKYELVFNGDESGIIFDRSYFRFSEWVEKDKIKIYITLSSSIGGGFSIGWYTYDLAERKIVDTEIGIPDEFE